MPLCDGFTESTMIADLSDKLVGEGLVLSVLKENQHLTPNTDGMLSCQISCLDQVLCNLEFGDPEII